MSPGPQKFGYLNFGSSKVHSENPQKFANRVRSMMAADLEVPEVELDYEDGRAMLKAAEFGLPGHVGLVNVSKFHKLYGFGREKIYEQLEAYSCLSQKKGKKLLLTPTLSRFFAEIRNNDFREIIF